MDAPFALLAHGPKGRVLAKKLVLSKADVLAPWALALGIALPVALFTDGTVRWLAIGLTLGLAIGAGISLFSSRRLALRTSKLIAQMREELTADADGRVAMVIRQFQWAVNDVTALQQVAARTKEAARAADERAHRAEQQVRLLELELYRSRGKSTKPDEPGPSAKSESRSESFSSGKGDFAHL